MLSSKTGSKFGQCRYFVRGNGNHHLDEIIIGGSGRVFSFLSRCVQKRGLPIKNEPRSGNIDPIEARLSLVSPGHEG